MRKMASIQKIKDVLPIANAGRVCTYVINGWSTVDNIGKYKVGDLVVFCEIDSFIPNSIAPFLTASDHFPKEYLGVKGERLKTRKLRGVISQGLILPLNILPQNDLEWTDPVGADVSELLGIVKYDPPLPAQLAGQAKGNFPSLVPRTDQNRIQNIKLEEYYGEYEVTEKLEGSSCTFHLDQEGNFEVCSRNLSLKETEDNAFWKAARMYNVEQKMKESDMRGFAIQGELVGEGIQGNIYNIKGVDFYVYDVYDTKQGKYLEPLTRRSMSASLNLKHVPVIDLAKYIQDMSKDDLLLYAEGKSVLNPKQEREGCVLKSINDPSKSFKIVSNRYLTGSKL